MRLAEEVAVPKAYRRKLPEHPECSTDVLLPVASVAGGVKGGGGVKLPATWLAGHLQASAPGATIARVPGLHGPLCWWGFCREHWNVAIPDGDYPVRFRGQPNISSQTVVAWVPLGTSHNLPENGRVDSLERELSQLPVLGGIQVVASEGYWFAASGDFTRPC